MWYLTSASGTPVVQPLCIVPAGSVIPPGGVLCLVEGGTAGTPGTYPNSVHVGIGWGTISTSEGMAGPITVSPLDIASITATGWFSTIEQVTKTWDREVLDHGPRLERWASFLVRMMDRDVRSLVYVNNHYAGHAPATLERLRKQFLELTAT